MTAAALGWVCRVIRPAVLLLAVMGADATTRLAHTHPDLPWHLPRAALAAGALIGGIWTITTTRQETNP